MFGKRGTVTLESRRLQAGLLFPVDHEYRSQGVVHWGSVTIVEKIAMASVQSMFFFERRPIVRIAIRAL
jgi:hypothetical protein